MAQRVDFDTLRQNEAPATPSRHQLAQISQRLAFYRYAPGDLILLPEDAASSNALVYRGIVSIVTWEADGRRVAGWIGAGQPISQRLLARYPQPVELRAAGAVILSITSRDSLPTAPPQPSAVLPPRMARRSAAVRILPPVVFIALIGLLYLSWQAPWRMLLSQLTYSLASIRLASNDVTAASALLRTSLELNPRQASAQNDLGYVYFQQGRLAEAQVAFHQAVTADPLLAAAQNNLGLSYLKEGRAELARAALAQAAALAPEDAAMWLNLGIAAQQARRFAEARQAYLAVLRLTPDNLVAKVNLGALYFQAGQFAEAQRYLEAALLAQPDLPRVRLTLGAIALSEGDFDRARRELDEVSATLADDPSLHFYLALWHEHAGALAQAQRELELALALGPPPDLAAAARTHLAALAPDGAMNDQP